MGPITLHGYYKLASVVVPLIKKYPWFKRLTKKILVDRLVDYGEWFMGYKPKMKYRTSRIVTQNFLTLCYSIGLIDLRRPENAY
jgi:hypothetical protein